MRHRQPRVGGAEKADFDHHIIFGIEQCFGRRHRVPGEFDRDRDVAGLGVRLVIRSARARCKALTGGFLRGQGLAEQNAAESQISE